MNRGFQLSDICGHTFENGMNDAQLIYFYNAVQSIEADEITNNAISYGMVMGDKDNNKELNKLLDKKRQMVMDNLIGKI